MLARIMYILTGLIAKIKPFADKLYKQLNKFEVFTDKYWFELYISIIILTWGTIFLFLWLNSPV